VFSGYSLYLWAANILILVILSLHFMRNEYFQYLQTKESGGNYFTGAWNYIDAMPPVMVLLIAIMSVLNVNSPVA
jgi:hypothetical protein